MPTATVDIKDLPARFDELLTQAAAGIDVLVTEGNVPRAKLVALHPHKPFILGLHPGAFEPAPDFDEPMPEEFWLSGNP